MASGQCSESQAKSEMAVILADEDSRSTAPSTVESARTNEKAGKDRVDITTPSADNEEQLSRSTTPDTLRPITVATMEKRQELIQLYANLFCDYFDKIRDPLERMNALSYRIRNNALAAQYQSVWALHGHFESLVSQYLFLLPEVLSDVSMKFENFASALKTWWPKCVRLSTQAERRGLVWEIVEKVTRDDFELGSFEAEYGEYDEVLFCILVEECGLI